MKALIGGLLGGLFGVCAPLLAYWLGGGDFDRSGPLGIAVTCAMFWGLIFALIGADRGERKP